MTEAHRSADPNRAHCGGDGWMLTECGPGNCIPCDGTGRLHVECKGCGHRPARGYYLLPSGYCLVCEVL